MNDVLTLAVKGCIGGVFVVVFSALSESLKPKTFAGLFAAAPSIALAALVVTGITQGAQADHEQSFAMALGALAMVCYCVMAVVSVEHLGALKGSLVAFMAWFVVAAISYIAALAALDMATLAASVRSIDRSFTEPIAMRFGALRRLRFHDLATRFAFGFAVSVLAGLVTLAAGDRAGGLFLAFPAILPASLTLIDKRDGRQAAEVDVSGAILGAVALASFAVVSWQLSGRTSLATTQTLAGAAWLLTAAALYLATRFIIRRRNPCE